MAFDGTEGEQVSLQEGAQLTHNHRMTNPNEVLGHFVGKDILNDILNQSGCMGVRIYYGIDSTGEKKIVLVGADSNQDDMTSGIIANRTTPPTPPYGSSPNPLNS